MLPALVTGGNQTKSRLYHIHGFHLLSRQDTSCLLLSTIEKKRQKFWSRRVFSSALKMAEMLWGSWRQLCKHQLLVFWLSGLCQHPAKPQSFHVALTVIVSSEKRDFMAWLPSNPCCYGTSWGNYRPDVTWTSWLKFLGGGNKITKQKPCPKNQVLNALVDLQPEGTVKSKLYVLSCGTPASIPVRASLGAQALTLWKTASHSSHEIVWHLPVTSSSAFPVRYF